MKPTLEQIRQHLRAYQRRDVHDRANSHVVEIYALELAEQVAKGEVVVVPKIPTNAMCLAGGRQMAYAIQYKKPYGQIEAVYQAMINAAQPPQEASDERD